MAEVGQAAVMGKVLLKASCGVWLLLYPGTLWFSGWDPSCTHQGMHKNTCTQLVWLYKLFH